MNKFTQILESVNPEERKSLFDKIHTLKAWLYRSDGLGMMGVIDDIFSERRYTKDLTTQEINKFKEGLELLNKTGMDQNFINNQVNRKLPGGIERAKLIRDDDGNWHHVNKLNTNYSDLADILTELVMRGIENNPDKGRAVYDMIMDNPQNGLLKLKPHMKNLVSKYFTTLDDFKSFTKYTKIMSAVGESAEDKISNYLLDNGFEIKYQGGNGDFIDMIFGTDLIVYRKDFGYKTIQVKNRIYWDKVDYYRVDWIGEGVSLKIFDKSNRQEIIIK